MTHLCVPQNQTLGVCRGFVPDIQVCSTHRREDLVNATITSNAEEEEMKGDIWISQKPNMTERKALVYPTHHAHSWYHPSNRRSLYFHSQHNPTAVKFLTKISQANIPLFLKRKERKGKEKNCSIEICPHIPLTQNITQHSKATPNTHTYTQAYNKAQIHTHSSAAYPPPLPPTTQKKKKKWASLGKIAFQKTGFGPFQHFPLFAVQHLTTALIPTNNSCNRHKTRRLAFSCNTEQSTSNILLALVTQKKPAQNKTIK